MANGQVPPQAAPQGAPQGGDERPAAALQAMGDLGQSMVDMGGALQESGAPPEALKQLEVAIGEYQKFMQMVSGGGEAPAQGPNAAVGPPETAGSAAVPVR